MMTTEEYKWTINLVKDRYYLLKLSFEQAELVYRFEQERLVFSDEHFFSVWEEMDYELDNFQKILNEKQFKKYYAQYQGNLKKVEEGLITADLEQQAYIDLYREQVSFLEQQYVPSFYRELNLVFIFLNHPRYQAKVSYLKKMYKQFLDSHKLGIIVNHYRHSKRLQPKTLQEKLLRHQINYLTPNYAFFKQETDTPTRQVAGFLLEDLDYLADQNSDFFKKMDNWCGSNFASLESKYIEKTESGWHCTVTATPEQIREQQIMRIVLMDQKMYTESTSTD